MVAKGKTCADAGNPYRSEQTSLATVMVHTLPSNIGQSREKNSLCDSHFRSPERRKSLSRLGDELARCVQSFHRIREGT